MPKFFVRQDQITDGRILLCGEDAFHISRSLRMAKGEHITVCDMQCKEYDCVLKEFLPEAVVAEIVCATTIENEPSKRISLYQALPKGDKFETVIQKSVECGAFEIIPFESERCIAKSKSDSEARKNERRNKIALEAAKQSGRGYVPQVGHTMSFRDAVDRACTADLCLFCYEGETEKSLKGVLRDAGREITTIALMIGSEGGFSVEEVAYAIGKGAVSVSLGKRILRTETVSSFVLGCLMYEYEM